jgi:hypothetical protein
MEEVGGRKEEKKRRRDGETERRSDEETEWGDVDQTGTREAEHFVAWLLRHFVRLYS